MYGIYQISQNTTCKFTHICLWLYLQASTRTDLICWETISVLTWTELDLNVLLILHNLWLKSCFGETVTVAHSFLRKRPIELKIVILRTWDPSSLTWILLKNLLGCLFVETTSWHADQTLPYLCLSVACLIHLDLAHFVAETLFRYNNILWPLSMAGILRCYWEKSKNFGNL